MILQAKNKPHRFKNVQTIQSIFIESIKFEINMKYILKISILSLNIALLNDSLVKQELKILFSSFLSFSLCFACLLLKRRYISTHSFRGQPFAADSLWQGHKVAGHITCAVKQRKANAATQLSFSLLFCMNKLLAWHNLPASLKTFCTSQRS